MTRAKHGGARPGAGRPRGTGTGRRGVPVMTYPTPDQLATIDAAARADGVSRSAFMVGAALTIAAQMKAAGAK